MATKRTENLIVDLAADLRPVTPLPAMPARMAYWIAFALPVALVAIWLTGPREDFARAIVSGEVLWSLGLALAASATAALLALRLSVPGLDQSIWARWIPLSVGAVWIAILAQRAGLAALAAEPLHGPCATRIIFVSVIPTLVLMRSVGRGFVLDAGWTRSLGWLAGGAFAAVVVQLVCPINQPAHLLTSHVLPVLAWIAIGGFAARARS